MIFKFLIFSILIIYLLARFWGFIYRIVAAFQGKDPTGQFQKKSDKQYETKQQDDLRILIPRKDKKGNQSKSGEYVDYKEIKGD
jgi:hypothetical protein